MSCDLRRSKSKRMWYVAGYVKQGVGHVKGFVNVFVGEVILLTLMDSYCKTVGNSDIQ